MGFDGFLELFFVVGVNCHALFIVSDAAFMPLDAVLEVVDLSHAGGVFKELIKGMFGVNVAVILFKVIGHAVRIVDDGNTAFGRHFGIVAVLIKRNVIAVQTEIELVEFPVDLDAVPKELDSVFHFVTSCFFRGAFPPSHFYI